MVATRLLNSPRKLYRLSFVSSLLTTLYSKREKRHREDDEEDDRDVSGRSHRYRREDDRDYDRDRSDRGTGTGTERGDTATDAVTKLKRNVGNATVDVRRRPRKNVRRGIDEEGSVN